MKVGLKTGLITSLPLEYVDLGALSVDVNGVFTCMI